MLNITEKHKHSILTLGSAIGESVNYWPDKVKHAWDKAAKESETIEKLYAELDEEVVRLRRMLCAALDDNWEDVELTAFRAARSGWTA